MNVPPPRTYQYFIDRDGDWWCEGWPVDDLELRDSLSRTLFREDGQLLVRCDGEVHPVATEVAPLFVRDVELREGQAGDLAEVELRLHDGRREALRADTLRVDAGGRLFCDASDVALPALFLRPVFYRLMRYLEGEPGGYYLRIGGREWAVRSPDGV